MLKLITMHFSICFTMEQVLNLYWRGLLYYFSCLTPAMRLPLQWDALLISSIPSSLCRPAVVPMFAWLFSCPSKLSCWRLFSFLWRWNPPLWPHRWPLLLNSSGSRSVQRLEKQRRHGQTRSISNKCGLESMTERVRLPNTCLLQSACNNSTLNTAKSCNITITTKQLE